MQAGGPQDATSSFTSVPLRNEDFFKLSHLIRELSGIEMNETKFSLIQSRLQKRLKALRLASFQDYINYLHQHPDSQEWQHFTNALTTNKTHFFREKEHFSDLYQICRERYLNRTIYVWSACCSTGEEVYTLAMTLEKVKQQSQKFNYRILGSDIDTNCLARASKALYDQSSLFEMSDRDIASYFRRRTIEQRSLYEVNPNLRTHTKFRQINLIDDHLRLPMQFDVIFLRNVLIYFSKSTQEKVISVLSDHLKPSGRLYIGHSENLNQIKTKLKNVGRSVYEK